MLIWVNLPKQSNIYGNAHFATSYTVLSQAISSSNTMSIMRYQCDRIHINSPLLMQSSLVQIQFESMSIYTNIGILCLKDWCQG